MSSCFYGAYISEKKNRQNPGKETNQQDIFRASLMAQQVKNLPAMQETQEMQVRPWNEKIPWRRKRQPTPVFLPEKSCGQRSLAGYSPKGYKESDTTERLTVHRVMS